MKKTLPPSTLHDSSWDGSGFEFNERGGNVTLHGTQMGPWRVPNQFLLDKGKNHNTRDVYGSDEGAGERNTGFIWEYLATSWHCAIV